MDVPPSDRIIVQPATAADDLDDEPVVHAALILIGGVRIIVALALGEPFGAEVTVAGLLLLLGLAGAVRRGLRPRVVPAAIVVVRPMPRWWGYATAVAVIALTTAIGLVIARQLALADLGMLYLPAVMLASLAGRGPALLAATLAVAAFDFCFVPPRFTFVVNDTRHGVTFAAMFLSGLAISTLTERLRRQQALAQQAALRAHTEEVRSTLLSGVSHDLRTPLAVITGAATTLRDRGVEVPATTRDELLDTIVAEADRLERMLRNLLGLTRVESGLAPAREWVPVEELVGGALTRLDHVIGDRVVELEVPAELSAPVDPILFEQVLINLVENALKHGAPPLTIRAARERDQVVIEVADRGAGLPPGDEERVFEKFFRASSAPGAGLGLALVRAIVEAHGGQVTAATRAGGGTCVRIALTATAAPTPTAPGEPS